jgi:hypothetical protein
LPVFVSLLAALAVSLLPAVGLYFAVRAVTFVVRLLIEEWRIGQKGVETAGKCVELIPARRGMRLLVRFVDSLGEEHSFKSRVLMEVRIPQAGDAVGVVYLPDRPAVARITPRKATADNIAWGCVALPFLAAVCFGAAALIVSLLWEAATR